MVPENAQAQDTRHRLSRREFLKLIGSALTSVAMTGCWRNVSEEEQQVSQVSDGWVTSSRVAEGLDADKIAEMLEKVRNSDYGSVHSILIVKRGKLAVEEYFSGYEYALEAADDRGPIVEFGPDTLHDQASVSKSIISALIGIAIDQGFISGVSEKLFAFFPEYSYLMDDIKAEITLEHLLTMSSGLEWKQSGSDSDTARLFYVDNPIEYILKKPVESMPGTQFSYQQANPILLGEIIKKVTELRVDNFAERHLFAPLGVTQCEWRSLSRDVIYTAGDARLRPRDMAKFGYLFLQNGNWYGKRVISEEWVQESTIHRRMGGNGLMYGYLWWISPFSESGFLAMGRGGQGVFVFPDVDLVAVFTGGSYARIESANETYAPISLTQDYILPSIVDR
jgi:CubicO group peptidase (beta-lactamase class C family)